MWKLTVKSRMGDGVVEVAEEGLDKMRTSRSKDLDCDGYYIVDVWVKTTEDKDFIADKYEVLEAEYVGEPE